MKAPMRLDALTKTSDVLLGNRRLGGARSRDVLELGELQFALERRVRCEPVQQSCERRRKPHRLPDPTQRSLGKAVELGAISGAVEFGQAARQVARVGNGEVEAFGAGR